METANSTLEGRLSKMKRFLGKHIYEIFHGALGTELLYVASQAENKTIHIIPNTVVFHDCNPMPYAGHILAGLGLFCIISSLASFYYRARKQKKSELTVQN